MPEVMVLRAAAPREIGSARRAFAAQLRRWRCGGSNDAVLVFSELVTNAVTHAGVANRIVVVHGDRTLRLEVYDGLAGMPSGPPLGGHGLAIVGQVAREWGIEPIPTGKIVWADLPCCAHALVDDDPDYPSTIGPSPEGHVNGLPAH